MTAGKGEQRSFLGVYDLMLKTMQLDYAGCARFEASGYSEFAGKLYTLNANMFQSDAFCDRTLTQMILHYLTWFQDPGLQLVVGPGAAWHVTQDFRTQRYGDVLYVTEVAPDAPVKVGETVTHVNGNPLAEVRPEVERTLWTTFEPVDEEREDWSVVLAFAKHITVRGLDGEERVVRLEGARESTAAGDAEPGAGHRGQGVWPKPVEPCTLEERDGVSVLTLGNPGAPEFGERLEGVLPAARAAKRLVIDVRGARGGTQEAIYPLVELVLAPGSEGVAPAQLFGPDGIVFNYSRHNADAKLDEIAALRKSMGLEASTGEGDGSAAASDEVAEPAAVDPAAAEIDAFEADIRAKRGKGMVRELGGFYPEVTFAASPDADADRRVVVLTDRFTGEAAEWLVRAARSAGFATIMGRSTIGSLDSTCPRVVRLDHDFSLVVPTATYLAAVEGMATMGRGIAPDVHIAWAPEQMVRDVELEAACERAAQ